MRVADSTSSVEMPEVSALKEKISRLQESLQQALPNYSELLFTIHQGLKKDANLVHLLTPEEVSVIVAGLEKRTAIVISPEVVKKKSLKNITADDI